MCGVPRSGTMQLAAFRVILSNDGHRCVRRGAIACSTLAGRRRFNSAADGAAHQCLQFTAVAGAWTGTGLTGSGAFRTDGYNTGESSHDR